MKTRLFEGCVVLMVVVAALGAYGKYAQQRESNANAQFDANVRKAVAETSSPCTSWPLRLVQPPQYSTRRAVLVIGGTRQDDDLRNVTVRAFQPTPAERPVTLFSTYDADPYRRDIAYAAADSLACRAGMEKQIKYSLSEESPNGVYGIDGGMFSPWPVVTSQK